MNNQQLDDRTEWRREISTDLAFIRHELVALITDVSTQEASQDTLANTQAVAAMLRNCDRYEAESRSMLQVVR